MDHVVRVVGEGKRIVAVEEVEVSVVTLPGALKTLREK